MGSRQLTSNQRTPISWEERSYAYFTILRAILTNPSLCRNQWWNHCDETVGSLSDDLRAHMTEISSFALINEFFLRGATERNTR